MQDEQACLVFCFLCSCGSRDCKSLELQLKEIIAEVQGTVGVAIVSESDTITFNNDVRFPMMSVFKLHQSLATIHQLDSLGCTADTVLTVCSDEIDRDTQSPMLDIYDGKDFRISVADLIKYSLTVSDNNASNQLFSHIISPVETNAFIKKIASDTTFNIAYSESEMKADHSLSYSNSTTPFSAALLVRQVFTTEMVSQPGQALIKEALSTVATGQDRLGAILKDDSDIFFVHKTGSGYRNYDGKLMAHNDVGYFSFPDGQNYTAAVFITDFRGSDAEASAIIADVSRTVYYYFITPNK